MRRGAKADVIAKRVAAAGLLDFRLLFTLLASHARAVASGLNVALPAKMWVIASVAVASLLAIGPSRAAQYAIDGFAVGQAAPGNANYGVYACKPDQQFADALACERTQQKKFGNNTVAAATTLVHARDGTIFYITLNVPPVAMPKTAVQSEIDELARTIGAKPVRVERREPSTEGGVTSVVATWGGIDLESVQGNDLDTLAATGRLHLGLTLDPQADPKVAATDSNQWISRISGSAGFIYIASFDKQGRTQRRYIAIDPKQVAIGQFKVRLQGILQKDRALPDDDYSLWPDVAWITRNLARDTSAKIAVDLLDAGFEQSHSGKLRSSIWVLLPLGAIHRLAAGQYSRIDSYGPATKKPAVRRDIENFLAAHPTDRFVDFAYYLLGDYEKAIKERPNSPLADVLHYAIAYKIFEGLMQDSLSTLKARPTPGAPAEVRDSVDELVDESPDTEDHVNSALRAVNANLKIDGQLPLANLVPSFAERTERVQHELATVVSHPKSPMADDAAFLVGWLNLQLGKTDAALEGFAKALVIGNGDYKKAANWEVIRIMERMPPSRQVATVSANRAFAQQSPLWYQATRSAYRNFEYSVAVAAGQQALGALKVPFDDLPVTTDPDRIIAAIEKTNRDVSDDANVVELPYIVQASREMMDYEVYLKDAGKESPDAFFARAQKIILKYSMLVNPPEPARGKPKPPPIHHDLRQALHLIELTLQAAPKEPAYARLREWLRFRTVRIMALYAPARMPQAIAALAEEFPSSRLLDDAMAEQIFAEGIVMKNPDAAQKTFAELLSKYPKGNAVDNAYSWMAIIMRCAKRLDEESKLNAEIIRRFPLTRHAKYARERIADPDTCLAWEAQ